MKKLWQCMKLTNETDMLCSSCRVHPELWTCRLRADHLQLCTITASICHRYVPYDAYAIWPAYYILGVALTS